MPTKNWFCNHKLAVSRCIFRGVLRREELYSTVSTVDPNLRRKREKELRTWFGGIPPSHSSLKQGMGYLSPLEDLGLIMFPSIRVRDGH